MSLTSIQVATTPAQECISPAISIGLGCGSQAPLAVVIRINPTLISDNELGLLREDMFWYASAALQKAREGSRKGKSETHFYSGGHIVAPGIALSSSLLGDCEVCVEIDPASTSMARLRNAWDRTFSNTRAQVSAMRNYAEVQNV